MRGQQQNNWWGAGQRSIQPASLILLEGLPGSGKSILAQRIWLQYLKQGIPAVWYNEQAAHHPIYSIEQVMHLGENTGALHLFCEQSFAKWQMLVEQHNKSKTIVILDGAFSSYGLYPLYLKGWGSRKLYDYLSKIFRIIAPLKPIIIDLYHGDNQQFLKQLDVRHGQMHTLRLHRQVNKIKYNNQKEASDDEVSTLLAQFQKISHTLFRNCSGEKLSIQNTIACWPACHHLIAYFLGLPSLRLQSIPESMIQACKGSFREERTGMEWKISPDKQSLIIENQLKLPLLYKGGTRFCLQGLNLELEFMDQNHGCWNRIQCAGDTKDPLTNHSSWRRIS
ncbi:hypothetical protein ACQZV8_13570 [Magnetococcales bacterium HHB-1]